MRRLWTLLLCLLLVLSLAGCGHQKTPAEAEKTEQEPVAGTPSDEEAVEQGDRETEIAEAPEEELLEITIPASFFADDGEEDSADADTLAGGALSGQYEDAVTNSDGSVTYRMTASQHQQALAAVAEELHREAEAMFPMDDVPSVRSLELSEDFTSATLTVDYAAYENSFDTLVEYSAIALCQLYQVVSGSPADAQEIEIAIVDEASGHTEAVRYYPEDYQMDVSGAGDAEETGEQVGSGEIGEYFVEITDVRRTTDYDGNPALIITYSWTNNSDQTISPIETIWDEAYQDGVQMEYGIPADDEEWNPSDRGAEPGYTVEVDLIYILNSESPVRLELTGTDGSTEMVTKTFDLSSIE